MVAIDLRDQSADESIAFIIFTFHLQLFFSFENSRSKAANAYTTIITKWQIYPVELFVLKINQTKFLIRI